MLEPLMRRRRRLAAAAGFTLLELVVTTAVLAILALVALPAMGERVERTRLQAVAHALAADVGTAQLEARHSGRPLHIAVSGGADWCWSVSEQPGCACGVAARCQLRRVSSADHPGLALADAHAVALDNAAPAHRAPVAEVASRSGERLRVEVTPLGRPRLCVAASTTPAAWRTPAC